MPEDNVLESILDELGEIRQLLTPKSPIAKTPSTRQTTIYRMGLKGTTKSRSRFGYVVGREFEVSYEVTNLGDNHFLGGVLKVLIIPPNGQFVVSSYRIPALAPKAKFLIDKNEVNQPLVKKVMAEGFNLFSAVVTGDDGVEAIIESPPDRIRRKGESFMDVFGKPMEEVYEMFALYLAVIGLVGTVVVSIIQLLLG